MKNTFRKTAEKVFLFSLICLTLCGCFAQIVNLNSKPTVNAAEINQLINSKKYIIIHYSNEVVAISNPKTEGDILTGSATTVSEKHVFTLHPEGNKFKSGTIPEKQHYPVSKKAKPFLYDEVHLYTMDSLVPNTTLALPMGKIYRIDEYAYDRNRTATNRVVSVVGIAAVSVGTLLAITAIACNCPQVFVQQNGQSTFTGGLYSGAVYSTLERKDYLPLPSPAADEHNYAIKIGNVPDEEQFINELTLVAIPHDENITVLPDRHGRFHSIGLQQQAPDAAFSFEGTSHLKEVQAIDQEAFAFDNSPNDQGFSDLHLTFKIKPGTKSGKLILHASNSGWAGFVNQEFIDLFGEDYPKWRAKQEAAREEHPEKWQVDQSIPLKVFLETPAGWKFIDYYALTGNTATRDLVMEIDLAGISADKIHLKMETVFGFWIIDKASMDFSVTPEFNPIQIPASYIVKNNTDTLHSELSLQDTSYVQLVQNEFLHCNFDLPLQTENTSYFLESAGYYHNEKEMKGKANMMQLLKFRQRGYFDQFSREKYKEMAQKAAISPHQN